LSAALREIAADKDATRLEQVFLILALTLEREPLEIALRAMRTDDASLRGTALEYLDNVLPEHREEGPLAAAQPCGGAACQRAFDARDPRRPASAHSGDCRVATLRAELPVRASAAAAWPRRRREVGGRQLRSARSASGCPRRKATTKGWGGGVLNSALRQIASWPPFFHDHGLADHGISALQRLGGRGRRAGSSNDTADQHSPCAVARGNDRPRRAEAPKPSAPPISLALTARLSEGLAPGNGPRPLARSARVAPCPALASLEQTLPASHEGRPLLFSKS
jgi:hypothetical protein